MATVQLNVRVESALAARLKAEALRLHAKPGALVAQALEQFLSGASEIPAVLATPSEGWQAPLAALEKRVARLEAKPAPPPPKAPSPERAKAAPSIEPGDDAITSSQLASRLGLKRNTFNERLRRAGGASEGVVIEGWRCVGQARPLTGGPLQWRWQRI
jgi:hypothetical protein